MIRKAFKQVVAISAALCFSGMASAETLTAGTVIGNVPWEFQTDTGEYVGFDIDLAKAVADRMGRELVIENIPFSGLFSAVQSGRVDFVPSTVTITAERMKSVSFTQPYYDSDQSLTTRKDGPASLEEMSGKVVGVDTGATGDIWATKNADVYKFAEIRRFEGLQLAMLDLENNGIDGYISDIPALQYYVKDKPNLRVAQRIPTGEQYGWMFAKDAKLRDEMNEVISQLKTEGVLAELHEKWFGTKPEDTTSTVQVRDIPKAE